MKNSVKIEFTTDTLIDLMQLCYEAGQAEYIKDDLDAQPLKNDLVMYNEALHTLSKFSKVKSELLIIHNTINQ